MRVVSCCGWVLLAASVASIGCGDSTSSSSDGGAGQGGSGATGTATGAMNATSTGGATTSSSTASGGGTAGSCARFCATLFDVGCVDDEAQCVDGCLILAEGDPCPNELNAVHDCAAEFVSSCDDSTPECDDEDLAYEVCLS